MPCDYNVGDWLAKTIINDDNGRNWNIFLAGVTPETGILDPLTRVPLRAPNRNTTRTFGMLPPAEGAAMGPDPTQREHTWGWREFTTDFPDGPLTDDKLLKLFFHKAPMYALEDRAPFSKHQSTTFISVQYQVHPRLFPNQRLALRVGVILPANRTYALPTRFMLYDRGSYPREYDTAPLPGDMTLRSYAALRAHPTLQGATAPLSEVLARMRVFAGLPGPSPDDPQPAILISWIDQSDMVDSKKMYLEAIALGLYRLYDLKLALLRKFHFRGPFNVVVYDHSLAGGDNFLGPCAINGNEDPIQIMRSLYRLKAKDWVSSIPSSMAEPGKSMFAKARVAQIFYQFLTGALLPPATLENSITAAIAGCAPSLTELFTRNGRGYVETLRAWLNCIPRGDRLWTLPMFEYSFLNGIIPEDAATRPREDVDHAWYQYACPGEVPEPKYLKLSDPRRIALILYNSIRVKEQRGESDNTLAVKLHEHLAGKPPQESRQIFALVLAHSNKRVDGAYIMRITDLLSSPLYHANDPLETPIDSIKNLIPDIINMYLIRQTRDDASLTNLSLNLYAILNRPSISIQYLIDFFEFFSYRDFYARYVIYNYRVDLMQADSLRHSGMVLKMCDAIITYFLTHSIRLLREACATQNLIRKFLILFSRYCFNFYLNDVSRIDGKVGVRIMTRMLEVSNSDGTIYLLYSAMERNWDQALRRILIAKRDRRLGHNLEELTNLSKLWGCLEIGTQCDRCNQALTKGRRHHCRGCGGFFCNNDIRKRLWPTPSSIAPAEPHLSVDMYICDTCINIRPEALAPAYL